MKKRNVSRVLDAAAQALAAQIKVAFDVERENGRDFPLEYDVTVSVLEASPLAMRLKARLADVATELVVTPSNAAGDITSAVNGLVERWLDKHETKKAS